MSNFDKNKYVFSIVEGFNGKITEIQVKRADGEEISKVEIPDLVEEFKNRLSAEVYFLNPKIPEIEENVLHIYVSFTQKERLRRTEGKSGEPSRIIVPKTELINQIGKWCEK